MKKKNYVIGMMIGSNKTLVSIGVLLLRCAIGSVLFVVGAGKVF